MEHDGLTGGLYNTSSLGQGMLGLELPLQQQQQQQQNPNQNPTQSTQNPGLHLRHPPQMVAYAHNEPQPQPQQSIKHPSYLPPYTTTPSKPKQQQPSPLSDDDEHGFAGDDATTSEGKRKSNSGGGGGSSSVSPWQRMKWTDNMVRLLIIAVYYIGDDGGGPELNTDSGSGKKKGSTGGSGGGGGGGGLAQKKGKWKSVSSAMMEKGFYVSPQQCEDKFNDLNKRYKRVTDILGKGTACKVVENQSLLESMDLTPKMKEEVKKLLNSKHLFFREMCAYHNSCSHGTAPVVAAAEQCHAQPQQMIAQHKCTNSSQDAENRANLRHDVGDGSKLGTKRGRSEEADDAEDEDDSADDVDGYDDDEDDDESGHRHGEEETDHEHPHKRPRKEDVSSTSLALTQHFNGEVMGVIQDGTKSPWEKRQWVKVRMMQLEEQQVSYQYKAFELEKQRLKWVRFSSKKEREMERSKLENERRRLENERMVLVLRQKELELIEIQRNQVVQQHQNSSNRSIDPSSISG